MKSSITKLTFLACETRSGDSPTLYATDRGTFVVQGWRVTDPAVRAQVRNLPNHEEVIEIPSALIKHFPRQV